MNRPGDPGACYLLCWAATPYPHGRWPCHYLGFAYPERPPPGRDVLAPFAGVRGAETLTVLVAAGIIARDIEHRSGRGARLLAAVAADGITWGFSRVWDQVTEYDEKGLKDLNNRRRLCPACNPGTRAGTVISARQYRRKNTLARVS